MLGMFTAAQALFQALDLLISSQFIDSPPPSTSYTTIHCKGDIPSVQVIAQAIKKSPASTMNMHGRAFSISFKGLLDTKPRVYPSARYLVKDDQLPFLRW